MNQGMRIVNADWGHDKLQKKKEWKKKKRKKDPLKKCQSERYVALRFFVRRAM